MEPLVLDSFPMVAAYWAGYHHRGDVPLRRIALDWLKDDQGQDIVEYTLLMAFVVFASAAIFNLSGGSIKGIWCQVNSELVAGQAEAS